MGSGTEPPRELKAPDPTYPAATFGKCENKTVVLAIIVDPKGKPSSFVVIAPTPSLLDIAAIEAVQGWKFLPASDHGKPIPVAINVEVNFRTDWTYPPRE